MSSFDKKFNHLKIPLVDIQTATNHFADENLIGNGGFGNIYKGQLSRSGKLIDIVARRLDAQQGQGTKEFQTEIMRLASLKHPNLVSIVGFCDENEEKIVINQFEANGSLDQYINDPVTLPWTQRLKICLDIARALSYIHYDKGRALSIIHRNVKSSKICLSDKWEAKLSGFELSTTQPASQRHGLVLDEAVGTPGYVDPASLASATVSHKSDVYSLGVILFEVLSGMKAFSQDNNGPVLLSELAKSHYVNETLSDIIHPGLEKQMHPQSLKKFSEAAYCCLKKERSQRPNIDQVIFALDQALKFQLEHEDSDLKEHSTLEDYWKDKNLEHLKIGFDAIKLATENFSEKYHIGSGGFADVYKAELEHFDSSAMRDYKGLELPRRRSTVAIKRILNKKDTQGEQGFIAEIETLSSCQHPNIVSLLGFCHEHPHMIVIYELVSNGSLDDYFVIEGRLTNLTWVQRLKICIGIARGLGYIHTTMDTKQKIIHRDIKSANILLDKNWEPKIADFGLSKFHPLHHIVSTINTTNIAGTQVYLDPEYEKTGKLKKESDVYSFGVVLFEILSGRLAYDPIYMNEDAMGIAPIVRRHFKQGTILEMVDPSLKEESTFTLSKGPNQDSLNTFTMIGHQCLAETQAKRPTMEVVIEKLEKALNFQETHKDNLRISFEDINLATQNFNNQIGRGGFGRVYQGEIKSAKGSYPIAVKRLDKALGQGEKEFLTEVEILFEYKHDNIIGLVGYCNDKKEKILVYEYASNGSLDRHLKDASLTWTKRLKIAIDVATGLDFLHGGGSTQAFVIHRDIKSSNILLSGERKPKITDFGLSMITPVNNEFDFVIDNPCGTLGYVDPQYFQSGFLTRETDIFSLGVVLFEMMCGRMVFLPRGSHADEHSDLVHLVKRSYEEGKLDELVFDGIKDKIVPKSLTIYQRIAYECIHNEREKRPTSSKVVSQLKEALKFQEDVEIWESKLPGDYKEIIEMSRTPQIYSSVSNKYLYDRFYKGILLHKGKVFFSLSNNGERHEMVSATMFSYENNRSHKRISIENSRFKRGVKILDILNLKIQVKIKTQFLSPKLIYGAHIVFKFCDPRKISSKLMYVNLKYQMLSETRQAYFATCKDHGWMTIELCRFIPHKNDVEFEVLLESLSRYYCGNGAIYVEGIHFQAINDASLKGVERALKSNSDSVQQVSVDYDELTQIEVGGKLLSFSKTNGKKCHMLPAKMVLYNTWDVNCYNWKSLAESSFLEVVELLSEQVFQIKCKIEAQKLSPETNYACYLVFKLSEQCDGLQCPVKLQDLLIRKDKELKFLYFRSPRLVNLHGNGRVPEQREDGLMEVIVWEFNTGNNHHIPMSLKLRCYEGNMNGLILYGIEFRPI